MDKGNIVATDVIGSVDSMIIDEALTRFSELELTGQSSRKAVITMFRDDRLKALAWVEFFTLYGLLIFRRNALEEGGR